MYLWWLWAHLTDIFKENNLELTPDSHPLPVLKYGEREAGFCLFSLFLYHAFNPLQILNHVGHGILISLPHLINIKKISLKSVNWVT